jgi:hypothetical protein
MKPFSMTDMVMTPQEADKSYGLCAPAEASKPRYPYGLCISLDQESLNKLGLEPNCSVGDMLHIFAMAKVTSVSQRDTDKGADCRIELQITHMGVEDEDAENMQASRASKRYGGEAESEEAAEGEA